MKWLRHKRARQTEEKIFDAYLKLRCTDAKITPRKLAKASGVSRATLYRHDFLIGRVKKNYNRKILIEYRNAVRRARKDLTVEQLIYRVLLFIVQRKKMCRFLMENGDGTLVRGMLGYIKMEIMTEYSLHRMAVPVFDVYTNEANAVISNWGEYDFDENMINEVHEDLIYLARTASVRLGGLRMRKKGD